MPLKDAKMREYLFVADNLALDFVNTEMMLGGQHVDALQSPVDLCGWITQARARYPDAGYLKNVDARESSALLGEALELRRAIRSIMKAIVSKHRIPGTSVEMINRTLRGVPLHRELTSSGKQYKWSDQLVTETETAILYPIARAAGDLLVGGKFDRIKKCGNPDCILFLYDTTRSHTRQWCSMAACGNRMKVAAFYKRQRAGRRASQRGSTR